LNDTLEPQNFFSDNMSAPSAIRGSTCICANLDHNLQPSSRQISVAARDGLSLFATLVRYFGCDSEARG
jgi:hypothetical protein